MCSVEAVERVPVEIVALLASPVHAYEGRPADGPRADPLAGARDRVEVRAHRGVLGDRYCDHPAHRDASLTLFAVESLEAVAGELGLPAVPDPLLARRNVVLRGYPVDALAAGRLAPGRVLGLDSGHGPIRIRAGRPANPCAWMDVALAPGAHRALRRRGGVRCVPLDDGTLTLGAAELWVEPRR